MAKIGVELSITMRIGDPQMNEYAKVRINVDDIETGEDLEKQLRSSAQAIGATYDIVNKMVDTRVNKLIGGGA